MLSALKFVQGATSTKGLVQELTHFRIKDGVVVGHNGSLALCAPLEVELDCCPHAATFVKAIEACEDTIQLALMRNGNLSVRSGKFRVSVPTVPVEAYPEVAPEGESVQLDGGLLEALAALLPVVAEDASRPWANGVLLDGDYAYATNNIILVERWLGYHFPFRVNLPHYAVRELLRIGEEPERVLLGERSMTFFYSDSRWLRTQLFSVEWPDVSAMLPTAQQFKLMQKQPLEEDFYTKLRTLVPFLDQLSTLVVNGHHACTAYSEEEGASLELQNEYPEFVVSLRMLLLLEGLATMADFDKWPAPIPFFGDRARGVLAGIRRGN